MYKGTFHCYFGDIENYPFELQTCSFNIYPMKSFGPFKLDAKNLSVHPCIEPGMEIFAYKIVEWKMESKTESKTDISISYHSRSFSIYIYPAVVEGRPSQQLTVSFSMKRNLMSVFMVTYLPTILMNAMNQATVYIE